MNEKTYVPKSSAKLRQTKIGDIITLGFNVAELVTFAQKHANEKGYINLDIVPRRTPDERNTHSVVLNDWKPQPKADAAY